MMPNQAVKVMSIMAHQDDVEFNAGGTLALMRERFGKNLRIKIVATTRGALGHHELSPEETFVRRAAEAKKSGALIGAEYECLRLLDGSHLPGQVLIDRNLLGGIWNTIRKFEPDVIFCPPVVTDPLAGVHIDHFNTANAVRWVAYQLVCPHAYPTMNGSTKKRIKSPLIINVDDIYACESGCHFQVDVSAVYELKKNMARCHESQIYEWLPFTEGNEGATPEEWAKSFDQRHDSINCRYGMPVDRPREFFRLTKWGQIPSMELVKKYFPFARITDDGIKFCS